LQRFSHRNNRNMAPSSFTPNERLLRKRLAARLRQRRCRQRKREIATAGGAESKDAKRHQEASSNKTTPTSSPSKVTHFVDLNQHQQMKPPSYIWPYPAMPLPPRRAPLPPQANGYYSHAPPLMPMLYPGHHHPYAYPFMRAGTGPYTAYGLPPRQQQQQPLTKQASQPEDVSRTVSRSPSDASMSSGKAADAAVQKDQHYQQQEVEPPKEKAAAKKALKAKATKVKKGTKKALMSTEKAAVVAMLSMKSSSSSDESDGDSVPEPEARPVVFQMPVASV
jgi:hypothetical protein